MIAGHDDLRRRQCIQKPARFLELFAASALRQIAGDDYHIRRDGSDETDQRLDDRRIGTAEMKIRKMY
jgi:hypothetical protein